MEYYINPSWVYWINVLDSAKTVAVVILILCGIGSVVSFWIAMENLAFGKDDGDYKAGMKCLKVFLALTVLSLLIVVFVPSKTVMIEMLVARLATKQNVELTVESLKSVVDYVAEAMARLK